MSSFGICSSTATKSRCGSGRRRDKQKQIRFSFNFQILSKILIPSYLLYPNQINFFSQFFHISSLIFSKQQRSKIIPELTMAAKLTKAISGIEHGAQVIDVESVKCECCGLTEECTPAYIGRVRERYEGRWICGLCAEAVKDESLRSQSKITTDEAVKRHMKFHKAFKSSIPPRNPTEDLISAMKQLLRRSFDSPKKDASRSLGRSNSCFSALPKRRSLYDD